MSMAQNCPKHGLYIDSCTECEDARQNKLATTNKLKAVVASPVDGQPFFSWAACENCGDGLGGDRYEISYRQSLRGRIHQASVCCDCFVRICG